MKTHPVKVTGLSTGRHAGWGDFPRERAYSAPLLAVASLLTSETSCSTME